MEQTVNSKVVDCGTESLVEFLRRPSSYADGGRRVECIETHISWVFLTGDYAYKLKKPVRFEFLDFSTPELRRQYCQKEIDLNRRLAPRVYIGVIPIAVERGRLHLGGNGTPVDWVVKMRRLPADRAIDRLIDAGRLTHSHIDQMARVLAEFYQQLPPVSVRADDYAKELESHILANRQELLAPSHDFPISLVKRIHSAQIRFVRLMSELFSDRVCDGRIVEGHGDLRPEHIYLTPEPTIIDCIEFSREFRELDVLDELSFLAMECAFLGAENVGQSVIQKYQGQSDDRPPPSLLSFYKSYRAAVRAKVVALRADQLEGADRVRANENARKYLRFADQYASQLGPPLIFVVRGITGSGKSTLAEALSESLMSELLQTDVIRHELFGSGRGVSAYNEDRYQPKNRNVVYDEMFRRADAMLLDGLSVVLDGTFLTASLRQRAAGLAAARGADLVEVHCKCPSDVAMSRITSRMRSKDSLSESSVDIYRHQRKDEEPDQGLNRCFHVDTTASIPELLDDVFHKLENRHGIRG